MSWTTSCSSTHIYRTESSVGTMMSWKAVVALRVNSGTVFIHGVQPLPCTSVTSLFQWTVMLGLASTRSAMAALARS